MEPLPGSGLYGFVFEEDEEISDRLPSPGSWSKWGIKPQAFNYPYANDRAYDFILIDDDSCLEHDFHLSETEINSSNYGKRRFDSYETTTAASSGKSLKQSSSTDDQNLFLAGDGQLEDSFLHSLFNGLPQAHITPESLFCSSPLRGDQASSEDFFLTMNLDPQIVSNDVPFVKSEKYPFSPSCSREEEEELPTSLSLKQNNYPSGKIEASFESEHMTNGCPGDEMIPSPPELALHEFETVLSTFPRKTRLSFRDALYRLAHNSRHNASIHGEALSSNLPNSLFGKRMLESGTNPIDRAVANLMFNKMDNNIPSFRTPPDSTSTFDYRTYNLSPNHPIKSNPKQDHAIPSFTRLNHTI